MAQCKKFNESHAVKYHFIENWDELEDCIKSMPNAIYRGQSDATWKLTTNFERRFLSRHSTNMHTLEKNMICECGHKYGVYETGFFNMPDGPISWLSLMQHYGGSTRLLDVTRSPYIALFFALADMKINNDACLWIMKAKWSLNDLFFKKFSEFVEETKILRQSGIDQNVVNETCFWVANEFLKIDNSSFKKESEKSPLFNKTDSSHLKKMYDAGAVLQMPIAHATRRSIAQQAEFLFPINPEITFEKNLIGLLDIPFPCNELDQVPNMVIENHVIDFGIMIKKLIIPYALRGEFLKNLNKMNINYETLFPDIEGLMKNITFKNEGD